MKKIITVLLMMAALQVSATDYYISTTGSDSNDGKSREAAFATIGAAQQVVTAGDNVYILPGTYQITEDQISREESSGPYKVVFFFTQKGQKGKPISFIGLTENGNRPVFDMSAVNPAGYRVTAFLISGQYLVFRNFEVIGMMVNITTHTQSENFRIANGSYNTFENIACHDGMGIGFYLLRNSHHNLFVNCDGYNNYDPISESGKGGQNDAFGCHVNAGNPGNIFIGCRAWNNSDDGYDLINCYSPVTFCYSFAYRNGYDADGNKRQDGNGFKAGGYGMGSAITLPDDGAPRHEVYHCIASNNKSNGIYSNHHLGGVYFHHNTSYNNTSYNYAMVNRKDASYPDGAVDVNGYDHTLEYNLSYNSGNRHVSSLDATDGQNTLTGNSYHWNTGTEAWENDDIVPSEAFVSTSASRITTARNADGMLSEYTLLYMKQENYLGYGADFSGYEDAIRAAKRVSGAEDIVENTYISENTTWDFSDLEAGSYDHAIDYNGLILRATTATNHGITVSNGVLSIQGNQSGGVNNLVNFLKNNKEAADDLTNTAADRCVAFNASVAGTTTVTFSGASADGRKYQIFFKATDKGVITEEVQVAKTETEVSLTSTEPGTFFISATQAYKLHSVTFSPSEMILTESEGLSNLEQKQNEEISISFKRTFDIGKASTICLPFDCTPGEVGTFATFTGVDEENGKVYMTATTNILEAGTPYLFIPNTAEEITFQNNAYTVPAEGFYAAGTTNHDNWHFKGTYENLTWPDGQTSLYGLAGTDFTPTGSEEVEVGSFVRFNAGITPAFRAYMYYGSTEPSSSARTAVRNMTTAQPDTMKVMLIGYNGKITEIGTIPVEYKENGEWFTIDGRRLTGKPSTKGIYINGGRKIVIE